MRVLAAKSRSNSFTEMQALSKPIPRKAPTRFWAVKSEGFARLKEILHVTVEEQNIWGQKIYLFVKFCFHLTKENYMKTLILVLVLASGNAFADEYYSVKSIKDIRGWYFIGGSPQPDTTLKTIVDKDGHITITDGDKWQENVRNYKPQVYYESKPSNSDDDQSTPQQIDIQSTPQQIDINALITRAKYLRENKGIGGAVEARQIMDQVNEAKARQNGTYDEYQRTHAIDKIDRRLKRIEIQQDLDREN